MTAVRKCVLDLHHHACQRFALAAVHLHNTAKYSTAAQPASRQAEKTFKFVVVGGGTGGMAMATAMARKEGKGKVAIIEPSDEHYYQPMWTLVGAGIKTRSESMRKMHTLIPQNIDWVKDHVVSFDPESNSVTTFKGDVLNYKYLIVGMGIQLNFQEIKGLSEALEEDPMVCCNYSYNYVDKTFAAFQNAKKGNAIFTMPPTLVKCAGAPQKIMYLAEDYFRRQNKKDDIKIMYNTSVGKIFGVEKYAAVLDKICKERGIEVNLQHDLVEIRHKQKEAVFQKLNTESKEQVTYEYEMLHVPPHMGPPDVLRKSALAGPSGYMAVNKHTCQHVKYPNVFGIGDCTDIPTSKTAAAAAAQTGILKRTIEAVENGHTPDTKYDGYTSCPLVTSYTTCVLAEFDFDAQPLETFPIDQGKERRTMYHMKVDLMPHLYWNLMVKGLWNGPKAMRKLLHLGFSK